jgi:hypothetical protein
MQKYAKLRNYATHPSLFSLPPSFLLSLFSLLPYNPSSLISLFFY